MIIAGISPDFPIEDYHADSSISRSGIKAFLESPYKYWAEYLNPERPSKESTPAMEFGSAFHCYILEPDLFNKNYAVKPAPVLLKGSGKEAYEAYKNILLKLESSGIQLIEYKNFLIMEAMREALIIHSQAWELIQGAYYEQSFFWQDEHSGLMVKARPDILRDNCIIDLKTCASADSRSFRNQMYDQGYHIQGAMIREGVKQLTGVDIPNVINICIEKTYPYQIGIKIISEQALEHGHMKFKQALLNMKQCFEENRWPSHEAEIIDLPSWAL